MLWGKVQNTTYFFVSFFFSAPKIRRKKKTNEQTYSSYATPIPTYFCLKKKKTILSKSRILKLKFDKMEWRKNMFVFPQKGVNPTLECPFRFAYMSTSANCQVDGLRRCLVTRGG